VKAQTAVFNGNHFAVVASCLEDLLFFRLGKEWSQRSELSSLLEQMQLSQCFGILLNMLHHIGSVEWLTVVGRSAERRFFRALSHNIYSLINNGPVKQQLQAVWTLRDLEGDINIQEVEIFVCSATPR
jgi:hypothetical protein